MFKMVLFAVIVIAGTIGALMLFNQAPAVKPAISPEALNLNLTPSPIAINLEKTTSPTIPPPSPSESVNPSPSISVSPDATKASSVIIKTSKGDITLSLYEKDAPNTVKNFINKSKSGFYNNLTFHRVEDWVIQGGDPDGNGTGGGQMTTELNSKPFVIGSLGVARGGDIKVSNDAQFFITKKDASWLNNQYTNFGIVKSGMDVVDKIQIGDKIFGIQFD